VTREQIRLECYREAVKAERTRPGLRKTVEAIANGFVGFCGESALRLNALTMALAEANPRANLEMVLAMASEFVGFAENKPDPKPVQNPKPKFQPQKRGKRSR